MKKPSVPVETSLMRAVNRLEKMNPNNYMIEDLRLAISQQLNLEQTVPLAIEILKNHPLAEGDHYPGDLLSVVMQIHPSFWVNAQASKEAVTHILQTLDRSELDLNTLELLNRWFEA